MSSTTNNGNAAGWCAWLAIIEFNQMIRETNYHEGMIPISVARGLKGDKQAFCPPTHDGKRGKQRAHTM